MVLVACGNVAIRRDRRVRILLPSPLARALAAQSIGGLSQPGLRAASRMRRWLRA